MKSALEYLFKGMVIFKRDGPREALLAFLRLINMNIEGYEYYLRYQVRTKCFRKQGTEPFTVINVSPNEISEMPCDRIQRWRGLGEVRSGSWDQSTKPISDSIKYRCVFNHFNHNIPWEKTDIYNFTVNKVRNGEIFWNGCRSIEDVQNRVEDINELHKSIKQHGYKSQKKLHGESIRSLTLDRSFDRTKEEVAVAISRDGSFLFVDGNHRLAIANSVGVEKMPVHVVLRHSEWEAIRSEIKNASNEDELSDKAIQYLDHPDISSLIPNNWK